MVIAIYRCERCGVEVTWEEQCRHLHEAHEVPIGESMLGWWQTVHVEIPTERTKRTDGLTPKQRWEAKPDVKERLREQARERMRRRRERTARSG